ncbi:hypothetical protein RR48_13293 [Papilio machaon]|uniref:Uncharacterized protein n=1 Tax=Papilio machaon TaxID=76193 RepID=A0A194QWH7_PAPMA|nr:hypothetical protein RR48_13293 [Papilio machaon]
MRKVTLFTILLALYFFDTLQQTTAMKTEQQNLTSTTPTPESNTITQESGAVSSKPQKGQGKEPNKRNALLKKRLDSLASKLGTKLVGVILALLLLDLISAMPGVREVRQATESPPKEAGGDGESNPLISITSLLNPSQFAQLLLAALTKPGNLMNAS